MYFNSKTLLLLSKIFKTMEEIQKEISELKWLLENGGQLYYASRLEKIEKLLIKELEKK